MDTDLEPDGVFMNAQAYKLTVQPNTGGEKHWIGVKPHPSDSTVWIRNSYGNDFFDEEGGVNMSYTKQDLIRIGLLYLKLARELP